MVRWKEVFLKALAAGHTVTTACRLAGITRATAYRARQRSQQFREQWEDAFEQGTDALEDEAFRRALESSDTLLIFLLKARRPHIYRDNVHMEHDLGGELLHVLNEAARKAAELRSGTG